MTELNNDKLLRDFFSEGKKEIANKGFSRRVIHNLPDHESRVAQWWTTLIAVICVVLFFSLGGLQAAFSTLREVLIGMIQHGSTTTIDPRSLIIASAVLLFLGVRKVYSMV